MTLNCLILANCYFFGIRCYALFGGNESRVFVDIVYWNVRKLLFHFFQEFNFELLEFFRFDGSL